MSFSDSAAIPLADTIEHTILMHRDVHFGGKFEFMLEYYRNHGKGILEDINPEIIEKLEAKEVAFGANLAGILLSGPEAERVAEAKDAYKKFRDLYEEPTSQNRLLRLLADLILSEEDIPEEEIAAIVKERGLMVPALIELLRSENYYDPLFPGYGLAPGLAAECLGKIGDKRAIFSLFESIGEGDFFNEDIALSALKKIGVPAKEFLLKIVKSKPYNRDNERAAIALEEFRDDPEVANTCFEILKDIDIKENELFATYLVLVCEGLEESSARAEFENLSKETTLPKNMRMDIQLIVKKWH